MSKQKGFIRALQEVIPGEWEASENMYSHKETGLYITIYITTRWSIEQDLNIIYFGAFNSSYEVEKRSFMSWTPESAAKIAKEALEDVYKIQEAAEKARGE